MHQQPINLAKRQAYPLPIKVLKDLYVMLMTNATHSDVTLANFHIVAEKKSSILKTARNIAIANQTNV